MSPPSIYDYEKKIREYIMNALVIERVIPLDQYLNELTQENPENDKVIRYAYIKVKNELTGFNLDGDNEEDICEQFKHI